MPGLRPELKTTLPMEMFRQMTAHANETPDLEVCGLIGARGQVVTSLYRVRNIAEQPQHAFFMEPRSQIQAMKRMRQCGECLFGIYHSHPTSPALPSKADREQAAYPGVFYFIVSLLQDADQASLRGFYFDGNTFTETDLLFH